MQTFDCPCVCLMAAGSACDDTVQGDVVELAMEGDQMVVAARDAQGYQLVQVWPSDAGVAPWGVPIEDYDPPLGCGGGSVGRAD